MVVSDQLTPLTISLTQTPALIELHSVDMMIPTGSIIGVEADFLFCSEPYDEIPAARVMAAFEGANVSQLAAEVMEPAGYTLLGPNITLFERAQTNPQARLFLAGRAVALGLRLCPAARYGLGLTPLSDRAKGDASMTIQWEMLDALTQRIVYAGTTFGYARIDVRRSQSASLLLARAFQAAVTNLMADPAFHQSVVSAGAEEALLARARTAAGHSLSLPFQGGGDQVPPPLAVEAIADGSGGQPIEQGVQATIRIDTGLGHGSGVIISADGYALTVDHVTGSGGSRRVVLADGQVTTAEVVRRNARRDVALIRLSPRATPYPTVAIRPDTPAAAETAYGIGAPIDRGLAGTVSRGTISAIRYFPEIDRGRQRSIQADVDTRPGSSGGPLLDSEGRLIGLAQSGRIDPGTSVGLGLNFFVPINDALAVLGIQLVPPGSLPRFPS